MSGFSEVYHDEVSETCHDKSGNDDRMGVSSVILD